MALTTDQTKVTRLARLSFSVCSSIQRLISIHNYYFLRMIQASTNRCQSTNRCSDFDIFRCRDASCSRPSTFELSEHSRNTCSAEKRSTSVDPREIDILRIFCTNGSFRSRWKTYDPSHECTTFQSDPVVVSSPRNAP